MSENYTLDLTVKLFVGTRAPSCPFTNVATDIPYYFGTLLHNDCPNPIILQGSYYLMCKLKILVDKKSEKKTQRILSTWLPITCLPDSNDDNYVHFNPLKHNHN